MMTGMKRLFSLALALALSLWLGAPAFAAETAANIQLTKTEGTVTVSKSNGKSVSLRANMRLYNGYNVTTAEKSYAWINLDSTKLMKLDASSSVEVRKNGTKLEVNVKSGNVSFDVSEKLGSGESLNVSTSTMAVGIRGTCGWASVNDQWVSEICILEGSSQCVVMDPVTSQLKSAQLVGGDTAQCVVYPQDKAGDKCDILMERQTTGGIPGFVLTELVRDVELCDRILDDSGLDVLADLAKEAGGDPSGRTPDGKSASPEVLGQAERVLGREEAETARKIEEIRKAEEGQENNISKDPVWEQGQQPGSGGGSGGSGGSTTPPAPGTYTVTFNSQGGPAASPASAVTDTDGKLSVLPTPEREGYTFDGWYTAADGGEKVELTREFSADTTVYAHWTIKNYNINFYQDGVVTSSTNINYGQKISEPTVTRPGYALGGWYKEPACINEWKFDTDTVPASDVNLYAKWIQLYTVTFDANGGSAVTPGSAVTNTEGKLDSLPTPTRVNYTFDGWYTAATDGEKVTTDYSFSANADVYARWLGYTYADGVLTVTDDAAMDGKLWQSAEGYSLGNVTSVTILNGVTSVADSAFRSCYNLESITIPGSVTSIDSAAFYGCSKLTSVAIPDSVTSIGSTAFSACRDLTGVTFGANSQLTSIGSNAFEGDNLTEIAIPDSLTSIEMAAFKDCKNLTRVTFGTNSQLTTIGWTVFGGCSNLSSITIPDSVTSIGNFAFNNCSSLTQINIPQNASMTTIAQNVFLGCTGLTSITIPNNVTTIELGAFQTCSQLSSITIPASVTSIGNYAFNNCSNLTTINFSGTKTQWNSVTKGSSAIPTGVTVSCSDGPVTIS